MNNTKIFHNHTQQKDRYFKQKQLSINMKAPSFMYGTGNDTVMETDHHCRQCKSCMENALKSHVSHHRYVVDRSLSDEDLRNGFMPADERALNYLSRNKRETGLQTEQTPKLIKDKDREKKSKKPKFYAVTKYLRDGNVFALKIKDYVEHSDQNNNTVLHKDASTCQVYLTKKSFSCKSQEGFKLLQTVEKKKSFSRKKKHISKNFKTSLAQ